MKAFKTLLFSFAFALICAPSFAQTDEVSIDFSANGLTINETPIMSYTTMDILMKTLGEPSRAVDYPSGETSMFYDDFGIVFFTVDNVVKGVGVNFNWDEDEKFPETSFTGELMIGDSEVIKDTKSEELLAVEGVSFDCPIPLMCVASDRVDDVKCMIAFKDELLTQVVFFRE